MMSAAASDRPRLTSNGKPDIVCGVLLLTPSSGVVGGIERYVETLEWAFVEQGIPYQRVDLAQAGVRGHVRLVVEGRMILRRCPDPTRLVVLHRSLLPAATILAREAAVSGMSVLCHGCEVWRPRFRLRGSLERCLMRRPGVRTVAVSGFTAGTLAGDCHATILRPALSREWFDVLARAADAEREPSPKIQLLTAFRLADWRYKGLRQLIDAVMALGHHNIRLTICGAGEPPPELMRLLADHEWCTLRVGLTDGEFAHQLAIADLFVLATRTRHGRRAYGEGFGLVLLEAQAAGTPVIVPAFGGSSDAYIEGVTGAAPVDETAEALANVLCKVLEDPSSLTWMGRRAAEWARESFSPERYAQLVTARLL
jgi:phosphatidylinositol alpha-1,6-mannosyltransferase